MSSSSSNSAAAAAPESKGAAVAALPDIVDLCSEESDPPLVVAVAAAAASRPQSSRASARKRKRITPEQKQEAIAVEEAYNTATASSGSGGAPSAQKAEQQDGETQYRQALGPVRMDFLTTTWTSRHAFDQVASANTHGRRQQRPSYHNRIPKDLYKELLEYKLNLPIAKSSSIFVRVHEARLDLLRVLITGPEGTPYANGCFLFDLELRDYPAKPPNVKFLTTNHGTVRFNPNLYQCGKVCLSILGTWSGPSWQSHKSTILQVLVSIQGLILGVEHPYFNEPGTNDKKTFHKKGSEKYNTNIRQYTLRHGLLDHLKQLNQHIQQQQQHAGGNSNSNSSSISYPEFQTVMLRHFAVKAAEIHEQLDQWTALDASLSTVSDQIREHLAAIVSVYEADKMYSSCGGGSVVTENGNYGAAAHKKKSPPETIVLLDD